MASSRKRFDRDISLYATDPTVWLRLDNISEVENRTLSFVAVEFLEAQIQLWAKANPEKARRYPALAVLLDEGSLRPPFVAAVEVPDSVGSDSRRDPGRVSLDYYRFLQKGEYDRAYSLLSEPALAFISQADFRDYQQRVHHVGSDVEVRLEPVVLHENQEWVRAKYFVGRVPAPIVLAWLVRESRGWAVAPWQTIRREGLKADKVDLEADDSRIWKMATEVAPLDANTWECLSNAYVNRSIDAARKGERTDDASQAVAFARRAVELDKSSSFSWYSLGRALLVADLVGEAEEALTSSVNLEAQPAAIVLRARARWNIGKDAEARADVSKALSLDPNDVEAKQLAQEMGMPLS